MIRTRNPPRRSATLVAEYTELGLLRTGSFANPDSVMAGSISSRQRDREEFRHGRRSRRGGRPARDSQGLQAQAQQALVLEQRARHVMLLGLGADDDKRDAPAAVRAVAVRRLVEDDDQQSVLLEGRIVHQRGDVGL